MTAPKNRSRSRKRRQVKTPGGETVTHYKKKKPGKHHCGRCGKTLQGVLNKTPAEMKKLSKSKKIPERPYAGILCDKCMEKLFRYKTRFEVKHKYPEFTDMEFKRDLTIEKYLTTTWWDNLQKKE
jgi:large subunit ribosomal protein L34e